MKKVVLNKCHGGFGVSRDALTLLLLNGFPLEACDPHPEFDHLERYVLEGPEGILASPEPYDRSILRAGKLYSWPDRDRRQETALRSHPTLVKVVELLGAAASAQCAELVAEEIPDDAVYYLEERDGYERLVLADSRFISGFTMTDEPLSFGPAAGGFAAPQLEAE